MEENLDLGRALANMNVGTCCLGCNLVPQDCGGGAAAGAGGAGVGAAAGTRAGASDEHY